VLSSPQEQPFRHRHEDTDHDDDDDDDENGKKAAVAAKVKAKSVTAKSPSKTAKPKPLTERAKKAKKRRDMKYLIRTFINTDSASCQRALDNVEGSMDKLEADDKLPPSERYSRKGVPVDGSRIEGRCPHCEWDGRANNAPSKVHLLEMLRPPTFRHADGKDYIDFNQEWPYACRSSRSSLRNHYEKIHHQIKEEDWPLALKNRQGRRGSNLTKDEKKERRRLAQQVKRKHEKEVKKLHEDSLKELEETDLHLEKDEDEEEEKDEQNEDSNKDYHDSI
jgi:hypothetical protein